MNENHSAPSLVTDGRRRLNHREIDELATDLRMREDPHQVELEPIPLSASCAWLARVSRELQNLASAVVDLGIDEDGRLEEATRRFEQLMRVGLKEHLLSLDLAGRAVRLRRRRRK